MEKESELRSSVIFRLLNAWKQRQKNCGPLNSLGAPLDLVTPDAYKMMLGPSTPLSPVFFDYGFDALFGTIVVDRDRVLNCIGQGANFRQMSGVRKVIIRR